MENGYFMIFFPISKKTPPGLSCLEGAGGCPLVVFRTFGNLLSHFQPLGIRILFLNVGCPSSTSL